MKKLKALYLPIENILNVLTDVKKTQLTAHVMNISDVKSLTVYESVKICADFVYLYILPTQSKKISLELTSRYSFDVACQAFERDPSNHCYYLDTTQCMNECNKGCGLLTCYSRIEGRSQESFSMCMPYSSTEEQKENRCKAYDAFSGKSWQDCMENSSDDGFFWFVVMVGILMPIGICFLVMVLYYRHSVKSSGRAPFRVPLWCPQWLFPRNLMEESEALRVLQ